MPNQPRRTIFGLLLHLSRVTFCRAGLEGGGASVRYYSSISHLHLPILVTHTCHLHIYTDWTARISYEPLLDILLQLLGFKIDNFRWLFLYTSLLLQSRETTVICNALAPLAAAFFAAFRAASSSLTFPASWPPNIPRHSCPFSGFILLNK